MRKAEQYLAYSAFSKEGLYDQLLYEQYLETEARHGVENVKADWNEQALKKAKEYLEYSSFSDQGLYDQLVFEQFTEAEAQFAIDSLD
ncbi:TPA: Ltp family lipoprotein [Streptococcus suis]|nr:Ltp family lipoprotein [Streptococcus suis]